VARPRNWDSLSPKYRARLSRAGITKSRYERGAKLEFARGHSETPEHGKQQASKNPVRYRKYLQKHERFPGGGGTHAPPEDIARELNRARDAAYRNSVQKLSELREYKENTVRANIYGGETSESGYVSGMSLAEARWTSTATLEELRDRARYQEWGNPWFYH
jgi:hypothetical protein